MSGLFGRNVGLTQGRAGRQVKLEPKSLGYIMPGQEAWVSYCETQEGIDDA